MSERIAGYSPEHELPSREEPDSLLYEEWFSDFLYSGTKRVDMLTSQQRELITALGYHYLEAQENPYEAMRMFEIVQDFEGLRNIADQYLLNYPESHDLPRILTALEDHDGIRDLLNRGINLDTVEYGREFDSLDLPLDDYISSYLGKNATPVATGVVNRGRDLIAIRNLAQHYDTAIPIARGGLNQGAIADLWGMPTRIADVSAHNRKNPEGHWVNTITAEDVNGKHLLLLDKDAVSGDSIRYTLKMLEGFDPASIGVYFTHPVKPAGEASIGTITDGLPEGLQIHSADSTSLENAGDAYIEAHKKLGTLYGRRLQIEKEFINAAQSVQEQFPELAKAMDIFANEQLRVFDAFNPNISGIAEVREQMLLRMQNLFRSHKDYLEQNTYDLPGVTDRFIQILATTRALPVGFESELIRARYSKQGKEAAQNRDIENPHYPSNPLAAFSAAKKAAEDGFDAALIVGPEGFIYEPFFKDLGIPTVAVNIPESGVDEPRSVALLDDLSVLHGKKVLVVEDDVRTGATLQALLEHVQPHSPTSLGLYLGQPGSFQKTTSIPSDFERTYIAEESDTSGKEFSDYLASKGLNIFKTAQ